MTARLMQLRAAGTSANGAHESIPIGWETVAEGAPKTDFLKFGDRIRIEMFDLGGSSIFGAIDQEVRRG